MQQSDFDLKKTSLSLRYRARSGEPLDRLLVEAFALVREAGRRKLNMRHFDVQLLGGAAVHYNSIVEMQTGEGKTLTATLPLYLAALEGKGAHLATVNDYLAQRDAEWMRPIYETAGHEGRLHPKPDAAARASASSTPATSPTARPTKWASISSATGCSSGGSARASATCSARCSAGPAPGTRSRCRASCISCWSTRPTASSSTRPARR